MTICTGGLNFRSEKDKSGALNGLTFGWPPAVSLGSHPARSFLILYLNYIDLIFSVYGFLLYLDSFQILAAFVQFTITISSL